MRHDSDQLASLWREHAALLRKYGAEEQAAVLEQCAAEVEAERHKRDAAIISLDDAVQLTGFSRSHLRRLWRTGRVRQLGTKEIPEFHAVDLPRKPGYIAENNTLAEDDARLVNLRMQVARAVVKGE